MRIVYVLGTSTGGVGTHVRALARDMADAGHDIGVVGPAATNAQFGFSTLPGVRFAALDMGTGIGARDAALIRRLRRLIRGFGTTDIVHAHGFRAGLITLLALRTLRPRPPFVLSLHNQASGRGVRGRVETRVETMLARGADLIIGASSDLVDRAQRLGARTARFVPAAAPAVKPVSAEAAATTRTALAEEFGFAPGAVIVLAVGRVAPQKNYPMLVRALGHLGEDAGEANPNLVVLVAGAADDTVLDEVRAQYEALGVASAIAPLHFLGPRSDIAELAAAADVFVLTSVWEARALVLQEALISGKAIVATATGGSAELVGEAGILVPDDDDRALARALGELASDPARRAELAGLARARGAKLPDEREVAEQLAGIYTYLQSIQVG